MELSDDAILKLARAAQAALNAHPGQLTFEAVGEALALFLCGEADFDASLAMITAA